MDHRACRHQRDRQPGTSPQHGGDSQRPKSERQQTRVEIRFKGIGAGPRDAMPHRERGSERRDRPGTVIHTPADQDQPGPDHAECGEVGTQKDHVEGQARYHQPQRP